MSGRKIAFRKKRVIRRKGGQSELRRAVRRKQAIVKIAPAPERPWLLNESEVAIVKNSIAKGASDQELQFCLTVARRYRLDPFKQQIWFVKRWDSQADNGHGGVGGHVWTPQVGINGLLFAAARDHKAEFGSISLPEFGPMLTISGQGKMQAPEWARVQVWKRGASEPTIAQAWWDEYAPADLSKAPFWRKMPRRMIAKCATALAIREAYPDLGGLYIPEEMDKMGEAVTTTGRRIIEQSESEPVRELTEPEIIEHDKAISQIQIIPWKEGRVALSGPGLNIVKAELSSELLDELDIKLNAKEKVVHMAAANVFKFIDRAKTCNVEATLQEPV